MFLMELVERAEPIVNFTHSTAFGIILCAGWLLTYLIMANKNKKMRNQCDMLLRENTVLNNNLSHLASKNYEENKKECNDL